MNNVEIVETEKVLRGIQEDCHTFATWKAKGYSVKKGEKAVFSTSIWKRVTKKDKETSEETSQFILKHSHFFSHSQVEKIK
jgi:hypothetical protein